MKKVSLLSLLLLLFTSVASHAQVQGDTLTLLAGSPTAPTSTAGVVGASGNSILYYWVVARYPSGLVVPGSPTTVRNTVGIASLNGTNYVQLQWQSIPAASSYYVVRTTTTNWGGACTSCVVATATTATSFSDQGGATTNFPPAGVGFASATRFDMTLDNQTAAASFLRTDVGGTIGRVPLLSGLTVPTSGNCVQWTANGYVADSGLVCTGSSVALTPGSVVFAGALGELSQNNADFFWDNTNDRLGINIAATPLAPFHINGQILINGAAALDADITTALAPAPQLAVVSANDARTTAALVADGANTEGVRTLAFKTRAAVPASNANTIVVDGDDIWEVTAYGADGAAFQPAAQILAEVDGTPGVGDMPGRLVFSTTTDGAAALVERMRITNAGVIDIGGAAVEARVSPGVGLALGSTTPLQIYNGADIVLGAVDLTINRSAAGTLLVSAAGDFTGLGLKPTAFADLGAPADGTLVYCSNCDQAAAGAGPIVCASSPGTGALAIRLASAWTCLGI